MATYADLIVDAFTLIRVARAGDVLEPENADLGLRTFNRILDAWNANRRAVYNETFLDFTLTPNHSPHTIGLGGDVVVAQRPVNLQFAAVNLGGAPPVFRPITVRDDQWYANQPVPTLATALPTDLYYSPDWPLGSLYFWPISTTALSVRLWMRVVLGSLSDPTETASMPPGYYDALVKTLAEELAPACGQAVTPPLLLAAREARALIFGNNDTVPRLTTQDSGMPSGGHGGGFNWRARTFS